MPTNPDANSVHANPSPAKKPGSRVMALGPYRVEIHGGSNGYWAQIRDGEMKAFGYGETLALVEDRLYSSIIDRALEMPAPRGERVIASITGAHLRELP